MCICMLYYKSVIIKYATLFLRLHGSLPLIRGTTDSWFYCCRAFSKSQ